ncbi:MAG: hypothetical protein ACOYM9_03660 [Bradymonadia bacterium]
MSARGVALLLVGAVALGQVSVGSAVAQTQTDDDANKARWQALVREAQQRVEDAIHALKTAELELEQAALRAVNIPSGETQSARTHAVEAVEAAKRAITTAEADLKALLERARTEGVPPGWLR